MTAVDSHVDAAYGEFRCYNPSMRTTVTLDADVAAAVERMRREKSIGVSEAINALIRAGLVAKPRPGRTRYTHRSQDLGIRIDVTNVAEALELLEGLGSR
jgi:hypothetical protein